MSHRRERPRRRAAEQRDEVASFHSITSSASDSMLSERAKIPQRGSLLHNLAVLLFGLEAQKAA